MRRRQIIDIAYINFISLAFLCLFATLHEVNFFHHSFCCWVLLQNNRNLSIFLCLIYGNFWFFLLFQTRKYTGKIWVLPKIKSSWNVQEMRFRDVTRCIFAYKMTFESELWLDWKSKCFWKKMNVRLSSHLNQIG